MWWLIVLILILGMGLWFYKTGFEEISEFIMGGTVGALMSVFVLLFCLLISFSSQPTYEIEPEPLGALADSNLVEGNFFLGCGGVNGELTYTFVVGDETNGFIAKQVSAKNCTIKYTDKEPYYTKKFSNFNWFGRAVWGTDGMTIAEYTFYVPKGTIVQNYNIDLQ